MQRDSSLKEVHLKPVVIDRGDYDEIERRIKRAFKEYIYLPLAELLGPKDTVLTNSMDDLINAIAKNRIVFNQGKFTGKFNSRLSKELKAIGAKWSAKDKAWKIAKGDLPEVVSTAVALSDMHAEKMQAKLEAKLSDIMGDDIASKIRLTDVFERTMGKVDKDIKSSMKAIGVPPAELTEAGKRRMAKEYTENLRLSIQSFCEEETLELRQQITTSTMRGNRYETMVDSIRKSYGISQNKAKFLARQETNLLLSKYKEIRYADAGVTRYTWRTVGGTPQHPVRPMHKRLEGKQFDFASPPITDNKGNRNNPGEDYGCRCASVPIVKF